MGALAIEIVISGLEFGVGLERGDADIEGLFRARGTHIVSPKSGCTISCDEDLLVFVHQGHITGLARLTGIDEGLAHGIRTVQLCHDGRAQRISIDR